MHEFNLTLGSRLTLMQAMKSLTRRIAALRYCLPNISMITRKCCFVRSFWMFLICCFKPVVVWWRRVELAMSVKALLLWHGRDVRRKTLIAAFLLLIIPLMIFTMSCHSLCLCLIMSKQWKGLVGKQRNKSALFQTHTHSQTLQRDLFLSIALKMCLQNCEHVELR